MLNIVCSCCLLLQCFSWIEQLIIYDKGLANYLPQDKRVVEMREKHPIHPEIDWILCQPEACAIGKKVPKGTNGRGKYDGKPIIN